MLKKTFKNISGDILVREIEGQSIENEASIVEMLHLWDENKSGCVIGYWRIRKSDGFFIAEFESLHDRFIETEYSFNIFEALKFGQKIAEVLIEKILLTAHDPDN